MREGGWWGGGVGVLSEVLVLLRRGMSLEVADTVIRGGRGACYGNEPGYWIEV
tara:strand:+ start:259 stop:417 length:159 start_codon:yes stop_codon:yes gene_type:complete